MNSDEVCVAIPVGGVVVEDFLIENLKTLRKSPCKVFVGIDVSQSMISLDNHDKVREICKKYAHEVIEFPSESYFRPGGFWKKIYSCWKLSGCKYVRSLGYDDLLNPDAIRDQLKFMKDHPELECSYSNCIVLDESKKTISFKNSQLKGYQKIRNIGRNPFSFISWLINFESIHTPDFEEKLERSSMGFEYFLHKELFNRRHAHFNSTMNNSPTRREHDYTISSYGKKGMMHDKSEIVLLIRKLTGYSEEHALRDWRSLEMKKDVHRVRKKQAPFLSWIAYLHDLVSGVPYTL